MKEFSSGQQDVTNQAASASGRAPSASSRRGLRDAEWEQILSQIARRDETALARFYDESSAFVYGLALRMLQDSADAEEITLDVYKQIWLQSGAFDSSRGTPTAWLAALTRSRAIDRIRSRGRRREVQSAEFLDDLVAPGPCEWTDGFASERRIVAQALQALAPEQRNLIQLAFFSGFTHSELSKELGLPLGTVKTRIRVAIMTLKQLLQPVREGR